MDERSIAPVGVAGSIPMQNKYLYGKIVVPSLGVCARGLFVNAPKKKTAVTRRINHVFL